MTEIPSRRGATYPGTPDYTVGEQFLGQKWHDGREIFRQVIQLPGGNLTSSATIPGLFALINEIVSFRWSCNFGTPVTNRFAFFGSTDNGLQLNDSDLFDVGHNGINLTGNTLQVVLEYTKP